MKKKVLFISGTRADFGKLKPLILALQDSPDFDCSVFVTGMHTLSRYGYTVEEVRKAGIKKYHIFVNQFHGEPMELILSNTIAGLFRYVHENRPDMIVVHGDRIEALAGATVGALRNILVAHIEGGEISGTVDELIRHAVSKLSHIHFVANSEAAQRLIQMGENENAVFAIGSPDIDIMLSSKLPELEKVKEHYEINFDKYAILIFHPVTTELDSLHHHAEELTNALLADKHNYLVIYPNNDEGTEIIFSSYEKLEANPRFRILPSTRFEDFLTLMKNAMFIIGNSSVGIREAPVYSIPTINLGTRQHNRFQYPTIINASCEKSAILKSINKALTAAPQPPSQHFGEGDSLGKFMAIFNDTHIWKTPTQKQFNDVILPSQKPTDGKIQE